MPLTRLEVDKAVPRTDGKPLKLADALGLSLWVMPNGSKYWRMKYRWQGKEKLLALGVYPRVTLKEAREHRDTARKLLSEGVDPCLQRKERKLSAQLANRNSFEALAREWHQVKAAEWAPNHSRAVLTSLELHLFPALANRPVSEIKPQELLAVLRQVEQTGKLDTVKRLRERCSAIFRLAIITGRADLNPAANLVDALQAPISKPRPSLDRNALPRFLQALNSTQAMTLQSKCLFQILMICFTQCAESLGVQPEVKRADAESGLVGLF